MVRRITGELAGRPERAATEAEHLRYRRLPPEASGRSPLPQDLHAPGDRAPDLVLLPIESGSYVTQLTSELLIPTQDRYSRRPNSASHR
jgi:hypothetical protein